MTWWWTILACAVGTAAVTTLLWSLVVRSPEPEPHDPDKTPYSNLNTPRHWMVVIALAVLSAIGVVLAFPNYAMPAGLVLVAAGVPLAVCDCATTWIPARLCHLSWAAMTIAVLAAIWIPGGGPGVVASSLGTTAIATGLFALFWRLGQCGFGDVRFVVLLGASTGLLGPLVAALAIAAGCLVAAFHVMFLRRRGLNQFYPWAPGLLAGTVVAALLVTAVTGPWR